MEPSAPIYKQLTLANWQQPDPTSEQFAMRSPIVGMRPMEGNDWARQILDVELGPQVPDNLHEVFGVARGCLIYGWFFYPLFRLGEEQLFRVGELAVKERLRQLDEPEPENFFDGIKQLARRNEISDRDVDRWHTLRKLRNRASHPEGAVVMPPGVVLGTLKSVAHDVNRLFASPF